jgi:oligopeptide transport system substrate-binding protein
MKTTRLRRLQLAVLLLAVAALIVPSLANVKVTAQAPKTLRYAMNEPETIDPQRASYVNQVALVQAMFRGLLRYNEKGEPIPSIAKEVPSIENGGVSKDGLTYTYKLGDFKWSDGKGMVTAEDFVYSLRRLADPATGSPYGAFLSDIIVNATEIQDGKAKPETLGVKAVDEKTLEVKLVKPVSYLNAIMSLWATYAVRKDNVERAGDPASGAWTDPANGAVVGNGPFILTKWDHNKEMVFEKNPNFGGTLAKLDRIVMPLNDDGAVHFAGYKAGQLDFAAVPSAEYKGAKADPKLSKEIKEYADTCIIYLAMDNRKPPFDNKKVRQAFATAINRELYVNVIRNGLGKPYYSFLPESIPGNDPELGKQFKYDAEKARKLLADAGYPNGKGFPASVYNYTASAANQRIFDWFQAQFKEILNVDIVANPMDGAVYQAANGDPINKLDGLSRSGWCADYLHASDYLSLVFSSGGDKGNGLNHVAYKNAEYDKLAREADNEGDLKIQLEKYAKAHAILVDDAPVAFMHTGYNVALINPRVKGIKLLALDGGEPGSFFWEEIDVE